MKYLESYESNLFNKVDLSKIFSKGSSISGAINAIKTVLKVNNIDYEYEEKIHKSTGVLIRAHFYLIPFKYELEIKSRHRYSNKLATVTISENNVILGYIDTVEDLIYFIDRQYLFNYKKITKLAEKILNYYKKYSPQLHNEDSGGNKIWFKNVNKLDYDIVILINSEFKKINVHKLGSIIFMDVPVNYNFNELVKKIDSFIDNDINESYEQKLFSQVDDKLTIEKLGFDGLIKIIIPYLTKKFNEDELYFGDKGGFTIKILSEGKKIQINSKNKWVYVVQYSKPHPMLIDVNQQLEKLSEFILFINKGIDLYNKSRFTHLMVNIQSAIFKDDRKKIFFDNSEEGVLNFDLKRSKDNKIILSFVTDDNDYIKKIYHNNKEVRYLDDVISTIRNNI